MGLQEELKSAYEGMRAAVQAKQGEVERSVRALEAELERKVVRLKAETEHTVKAMRAAMLESEEEMVHGVERVRVDIEAKIEAVKARAVQERREREARRKVKTVASGRSTRLNNMYSPTEYSLRGHRMACMRHAS